MHGASREWRSIEEATCTSLTFSAITRSATQSGCADKARIKSTIANWTAASLARAARENGRRSFYADAVPREGKARRKTPFAHSYAVTTFSSRFFPPVVDLRYRVERQEWCGLRRKWDRITKRDRLSEYMGCVWWLRHSIGFNSIDTGNRCALIFSWIFDAGQNEKRKKNWKSNELKIKN